MSMLLTKEDRSQNASWALGSWKKKKQRTFFSTFDFQVGFGESTFTLDSDSCSWLTELVPDVVLCCCSASASKLNIQGR